MSGLVLATSSQRHVQGLEDQSSAVSLGSIRSWMAASQARFQDTSIMAARAREAFFKWSVERALGSHGSKCGGPALGPSSSDPGGSGYQQAYRAPRTGLSFVSAVLLALFLLLCLLFLTWGLIAMRRLLAYLRLWPRQGAGAGLDEDWEDTVVPEGEETIGSWIRSFWQRPLPLLAWWRTTTVLTERGERVARSLLNGLDNMEDVDPAVAMRCQRARRGYAGRVARQVKADRGFGTPKYTEANLLVVRRKVADIMEEHGVRPTHIAALMPLAVALVFTPMREEILAAQFMASAAAAQRREEAGTWSRRHFGWLVPGPKPTKA